MDNQVDVMKEELELLKHVPVIIKAQQALGDIGSRESLFFFGRAKLRRAMWYEVAAFVLAIVFDIVLISAAVAATISIWSWLR